MPFFLGSFLLLGLPVCPFSKEKGRLVWRASAELPLVEAVLVIREPQWTSQRPLSTPQTCSLMYRKSVCPVSLKHLWNDCTNEPLSLVVARQKELKLITDLLLQSLGGCLVYAHDCIHPFFTLALPWRNIRNSTHSAMLFFHVVAHHCRHFFHFFSVEAAMYSPCIR